MKKIISIFLCVVLILSMFSCVCAEEKKAQIVVLKFDDVTKDNIAGFQKVIDTCKAMGVVCSVGVIGQRVENADQSVYDTIRSWSETGTEVWHHGYYHTKAEYWTESYESQYQSFKKTYDLLKEKCGITVTSFGSPHNSSEDVTQKMFVDHFPGINAVLYEKNYNQGLDAVYFTSKLRIESGTGVVDTYDNLVEKYHSLKDADYMICQGHPAKWSKESYESFIKLVNLMKADGCIFMTPAQYCNYVESKRPKVKVNGELIESEVSARISGEEVLVPFRAVFEKLGATVSYDEATDSVQAELGDKKITIANQSKNAVINGEEITSGAKAVILNGRMLLPVSMVCKTLGIGYIFDEKKNEVDIIQTNVPVIILKCDDYKANDMSYIENFDKFYNLVQEEGVTACFGFMANSSRTAKAANKPIFWENTKKYIENGIEIWSHGWLHKKDANNVAEFDGYIEPETAKENFGKALDYMKENTGYEITTFGPPFNRMNQTSADMIQETYPQIKTIFFSDETYTNGMVVLNESCNFEGGEYNFEYFAKNYEEGKNKDYLVVQMHVGKYTDEQREEVRKVIRFLKEQGCLFMTPSQYTEYAKSDNFGI